MFSQWLLCEQLKPQTATSGSQQPEEDAGIECISELRVADIPPSAIQLVLPHYAVQLSMFVPLEEPDFAECAA